MNILEYIDMLIEQGYSEEDANRCADVMFSDDFSEDDDYDRPYECYEEEY